MENNNKKRDPLIDRFVGYFSPEAGLKRKRARLVSGMVERAYEGASRGRRTDGWTIVGGDADSEISTGGELVADRARDLVRNNPYGRRAIDVVVTNTIGYGIQADFQRERSDDVEAETDKDIQKLWRKWAEKTKCDVLGLQDFYGLQQLAFRTIVESGSVLIRKIRVNVEVGQIPIKLMILEPDYIDKSKKDDNTIDGIKYDENGVKLGYWLYKKHPGSKNNNFSIESTYVPASEIMHIYRIDRAGQSTGVSWFAPVIITMRELDEYMDATIVKQKVSAAFAAFVRDIEMPSDLGMKKSPPLAEKIEPGAIELLPSGKDVVFPSMPSVSDFDPFTKSIIRSVSVGVGVTYEALSGDYSSVNFSSARMGWLEFHRNVESWRWMMFIPQFCDGVAAWFLEGAKISAGIKDVDQINVEWVAPRREMIDPVSETNSAINAMRGGIKSYPEVIRELGDDPQRKIKEIAAYNKKFDDNGLILDSDPRKTMRSGSIQTSKAPAEAAPGSETESESEETV